MIEEVAVEICKKIYQEFSPEVYPALTGGQLYKEGKRKDVDIVLYRNVNEKKFEIEDLEKRLKAIGLSGFKHHGFVTKCKYGKVLVDLLNPETEIEGGYGDE